MSCDAHFHVFGPADRYPHGGVNEKLRYAPPLAPLSDYLELAGLLGIERYVFVQPSAYGRDNSCMLDAMREIGIARCRGIVDVDENAPDALLAEMDKLGVRGVRINVSPVKPPEPGFSETMRPRIERLDARCAETGLACSISSIPGWLTEELLPVFAKLRCSFSVAHMGMFLAKDGPRQRGFQKMLDMLRHGDGRMWVKFTGTYRMATLPDHGRRRADGARTDRGRARPADLGQRLSAPVVRRQGRLGAAVQPAGRLGARRSDTEEDTRRQSGSAVRVLRGDMECLVAAFTRPCPPPLARMARQRAMHTTVRFWISDLGCLHC